MITRFSPLPTIHPFSIESDAFGAAIQIPWAGGGSLSSNQWSIANLAIFVPFWLAGPMKVKQFFIETGGTSSGNLDIGLYTIDGVRLVSASSSTEGAVSAIQAITISGSFVIGPGKFYLALAMNSTAGTVQAATNASLPYWMRGAGIATQTAAYPLPAQATLAAVSTGMILLPMFGISSYAVI